VRWAAALAIAACHHSAPIESCDDDLRGVYAAGNERDERDRRDDRWMILDSGATLEAYPLFPDGAVNGDLVVAPRVLDLARAPAGQGPPGEALPGGARSGDARSGDARSADARPGGTGELRGTLKQRFMRRAERCDAEVPVRVTRCAGDTLELVLTDPSPPIAFSPCAWTRPGASRVVRWRRERTSLVTSPAWRAHP
jgi:hypothetical protein